MALSRKLKQHLERLHEANKKPEAAINRVIHAYKFSAKRRNISFELTTEELKTLISQSCYYCEEALSNVMNDGGYGFKYNGIDRIDSDLGYTFDNCVSCCKTCNLMKGVLSKEEFLFKVKKIYEHQRVV